MQNLLHTNEEPRIRLVTFGGFHMFAWNEGSWKPITAQHLHSRGPSLTLLKILVCRGPLMASHRRSSRVGNWEQHEASRDLLIDSIWQDEEHTPADPFISLKVAKSELNRALRPYVESDVIVRTEGSDGMGYALASHVVEIDADVFEMRVRQASEAEGRGEKTLPLWEAAYAVVQGDFLPYDQYSDWAKERRERVQGKYRLCLHRLAAYYLEQGRTSEALERLHPYMLTHPADIDAICVLIPLLAQQGRYEEALQMMATCQRLLHEEGEEPSAAVTALEQRVREAQEGRRLSFVPSVNTHTPETQTLPSAVPLTPKELTSISVPSQSGVFTPFFSEIQENDQSTTTYEIPSVTDDSTPIDLSLPPHVLQLEQKEQALEQEVTTILDSSRAFEGEIQLSSMLPSQLGTFSYDTMTWFGMQVNDLKALGSSWQESTTCQQQQAYIHAELEKWRWIIDQDQQQTNEYLISRRMALATLATLSTSLLAKVQRGSFTSIAIEEFLAEATTSIVACWHLLRGDGLVTVEHALPKYLPLLIALVKQFPLYKTKASYLISQGFLLLSLVALHRLHFSKRVSYCKQAVEFAKESGDCTLLVASLMHLGDAFFTNGQKAEMLHAYSQAESQSKSAEISMFLRSKVLAELAHAYAQQGNDEEALRSVSEARTIFTEESSDTPVFLSTDYGLFQLILFEGLSALDLGNYKETQENTLHAHKYYQDASNKLSQIDSLSQTIIVPERIRVEIVNQRALAAAKAGNLDEFEKYLIEGAKGAKALASEKRRQEAITNWKAARKQWPYEKRIMELADVLF